MTPVPCFPCCAVGCQAPENARISLLERSARFSLKRDFMSKHRKSLGLAIFGGALAFIACGGSSSKSDPAQPSATNLRVSQAACESLIAGDRAFQSRCGASTDLGDYWHRDRCVRFLNAPGALVTSDLLVACATELAKLSCANDALDAPSCERLAHAKGTLERGAPCGGQAQCQSGYCRKESENSEALSCGVCEDFAGPAEPCGTKDPSRAKLCAPNQACVNNACTEIAIVGEGSACETGDGLPASAARCGPGLVCRRNSDATFTCSRPRLEGEPCAVETSLPCGRTKDALKCNEGICRTPLQGQERVPAGGQCSTLTPPCEDGLECPNLFRGGGTCRPTTPIGATCSRTQSGPNCELSVAECVDGVCVGIDPARCK